MNIPKGIERLLLLAGLALLCFCVATYVAGRVYSRMGVEHFWASVQTVANTQKVARDSGVDFSLWSEKRIRQYQSSLAEHFDVPLAVLRINKIRLEVPVFEGTDDKTLNRGAGRIKGTAQFGQEGNIGIAGHRDGFFRGLKDINVGDTVQVEMRMGTQTYTIDSIKIVDPNDISVLRREPVSTLTLVTCYPFYFVGSAPQRYIVHASITGDLAPATANASLETSGSKTKENAK